MEFSCYRILTQIGAGRDGSSYHAHTLADQTPVELRVLTPTAARGDLPLLARRLRLLSLLNHPAALSLREKSLDFSPPYIAMERLEAQSLLESIGPQLPLPAPAAIDLAIDLASLLFKAHRLGIYAGCLTPGSIMSTPGGVKVDLTGIESSAPKTLSDVDAACLDPENSPEADLFSLGAILSWLLTGKPGSRQGLSSQLQTISPEEAAVTGGKRGLEALILALLSPDRTLRPTADDALARLQEISQALGGPPSIERTLINLPISPEESAPLQTRARIGRFRLLEKLGEGGLGVVHRATDLGDGSTVAIKMLHPHFGKDPQVLRRFQKEARLLSEVKNPYVANLIEINQEEGVHYLALEFVAGKSLRYWLETRGRIEERLALEIMADVARALAAAHDTGIVHRDIKPENILVVSEDALAEGWPPTEPKVKLSDFGLARHAAQSESLAMTRQGSPLGTPLYMAPEQCSTNGVIDPRTDIYAMGATLFHLLAGAPPFTAENLVAVIAMHCFEAPPPLKEKTPTLSEDVCRIVAKCLAKAHDDRYPNASALLRDLSRLLKGEPQSAKEHPRLPPHDPKERVHYEFSWDLASSPSELWPYLSDTNHTNKEFGFPTPQFFLQHDPVEGLQRFGKMTFQGMNVAWRDHLFEWIFERRIGMFREFTQGPWEWVLQLIELSPLPKGGSRVSYQFQVKPRGALGKIATSVGVGYQGRKNFDRIFRTIDKSLQERRQGRVIFNPFRPKERLKGSALRRLEAAIERLAQRGVVPGVARSLCAFLAEASPIEISRIRPIALARALSLPPSEVIDACFYAVKEGLLVLLWDILCPTCRVPSESKDTLRLLKEHGRCEACDLSFETDFIDAVELIFRAHPEIRKSEASLYCINSPSYAPHVLAQVRVHPGERLELDLSLPTGAYRIQGPSHFPFLVELSVGKTSVATRLDLRLAPEALPQKPLSLRAGGHTLCFENPSASDLIVKVERALPRDDILSAARASSLPLFREIFPQEVLSAGHLARVSTVTLLTTQIDQVRRLYREQGDARVFALFREHLLKAEEEVRSGGGTLLKTLSDGVLASFPEAAAAVRVGLALRGNPDPASPFQINVGVHRGATMITTLNDRLDYFGATISQAAELPSLARGGEMLLTQEVASDPAVFALLSGEGVTVEVLNESLPELPGMLIHRLPR